MTHLPRIVRVVLRGKPKKNLRRRAQHLVFIRQLPCVACGRSAPSEAAHVRKGADGGMGVKPSDRYSLPLCVACHVRQHKKGEVTFWGALGIDALNTAGRLWTISGDVAAGERAVHRARQGIELQK